MAFRIIKNILSPSGYYYLREAEQELANLMERRQKVGAPFLKAKMLRPGHTILLMAMMEFGKIIIIGGGVPHILFGSTESAFAYNYLEDTLVSTQPAFAGVLHPGFNGRNQFDVVGHDTFANNEWSSGALTGKGEYVGGVNGFEGAIYADEAGIYLQEGDLQTTLATGDFDQKLMVTGYYDVEIPVLSTDVDWNQMDTVSILQRFLSNHAPVLTYRWTPSFFFAEEMNGRYATGWHYGDYNGTWSEGDQFDALTLNADGVAGRAQLLGFMEIRGGSLTRYKFGYCEALTAIGSGGIDLPVLSFFFAEAPPTDEGQKWFNWRSNVILAWADMRGGTTPMGTLREFSLNNPFGDGSLPTKTHLWAFEGWFNPSSTIPSVTDTVGIALIKGQAAKFYRYKETLQTVFETEAYHSHSLTPDGTILAVFEQADGKISKVTVFDLYGTKENPLADYTTLEKVTTLYTQGGFTLIREKDATEFNATSACLIPHRTEGFEPEVNVDRITSEFDPPLGTHYPAMGSLHWPRDGNGALTINKMVVTDGIYGLAGQSIDPCFDSSIVIDLPATVTDDAHLVTSWGPDGSGNDLYEGVIRGSFVGSHPGMRFFGIGTGNLTTVTLPEHFLFVGAVDPPYYYSERAVGELTVDGPADAPEPDCTAQVYDKYTATDSCGRVETITDTVPPIADSPTFTAPASGDLIGVGTPVTVTGGKLPYSLSATNGVTFTLVSTGNWIVASIPDCATIGSGNIAFSTFTVEDACGQIATVDARINLPTADWCCEDGLGNVYCIGGIDIRFWCTQDPAYTYVDCVQIPEGGGDCTAIFGDETYQLGPYLYRENIACYNPDTCSCSQGPLNGADYCSDGIRSATHTISRWKLEWRCP